MHRSHTSFLASWLQRSGLNMGDRLMPAELGNTLGFYEDLDFVELHEGILKDHNLAALSCEQPIVVGNNHSAARAKSLITQKNAANAEWGWKDPRTCLFFNSLWQPILANPKIVIIFRDYRTAIESLIIRDIKFMLREIDYRSYIKGQNIPARVANYIFKLYKKSTIQYNIQKYAQSYLNCWINYNEHCLDIYNTLGPKSCLAITANDLLTKQELVEYKLKKDWGFNLNFEDSKIIWQLDSQKRKKLVFNPQLEQRAKTTMSRLCAISV